MHFVVNSRVKLPVEPSKMLSPNPTGSLTLRKRFLAPPYTTVLQEQVNVLDFPIRIWWFGLVFHGSETWPLTARHLDIWMRFRLIGLASIPIFVETRMDRITERAKCNNACPRRFCAHSSQSSASVNCRFENSPMYVQAKLPRRLRADEPAIRSALQNFQV
jgi:hypothetical protein